MLKLLRTATYTYAGVQTLRALGNAIHRSPQENLDALLTNLIDTKEALMSLTNSPGASLRPSRQTSRNQARAQVPVVRSATTALLGSAGTDALTIGQWTIREDPDGNLTATHKTDDRSVQLTSDNGASEPATTPTAGNISGEATPATGATTTAGATNGTTTPGPISSREATRPQQHPTRTNPESPWTAPNPNNHHR